MLSRSQVRESDEQVVARLSDTRKSIMPLRGFPGICKRARRFEMRAVPNAHACMTMISAANYYGEKNETSASAMSFHAMNE
jgi:hypothetical protein